MTQPMFQSDIDALPLLARGKVRDIYEVDAGHLLIVATDRLSAFDVVLPDPIPGKGAVLTRVSNFWFQRSAALVANHLSGLTPAEVLPAGACPPAVAERGVVVRRLNPLPVEAIVRGYLAGSGWKDYRASGAVCGIALPDGLEQAQQLPEPLFTPSTKAAVGAHDENISFDATVDLIGAELAAEVRGVSIALYTLARDYAAGRGIIIADTKFEFGLDAAGDLYLIDEALTPDSSRFWPADSWRTGISPPSYDKQFVRDYLETLDWNKRPPAPHLPEDVIALTAEKYAEAERRLLGE
ncbi:MAG: phosphoribosylaminoimidazolesuccinocarboxamide synthase [Gammaproteobacteria bacterium]|nr:phosphoribosylaminoimidazolesuccinocarboxamide synthase [Gammaproteobacteria bacterium]